MCLNKVLITTSEESDGYHGFGYKAFSYGEDKILRDFNQDELVYMLETWYESSSKESIYEGLDEVDYAVGFHVFPKLEDLKEYLNSLGHSLSKFFIAKVKYKDILTVGIQYGNRINNKAYSAEEMYNHLLCLTAKWMYIVEQVA